jgi:hypothetical protein
VEAAIVAAKHEKPSWGAPGGQNNKKAAPVERPLISYPKKEQ